MGAGLVAIGENYAQELRDNMLVNLGIGIPTLVAKFVPAGLLKATAGLATLLLDYRTLSKLDRAGMALVYGNPSPLPSAVVTNTNDSGSGSLRAALYYAFDKSTGKARGEYEDFVTGFVTPDGKVWGRPVGITVAKDGSLLISEDGDKTIWRVSYQ